MARNTRYHRTCTVDDDTSNDLVTFCTQLIHHSQWKSMRIFLTGSYVEIPDFWSIGQHFDVQIEELDLDAMMYHISNYAFNHSVSLLKIYNSEIIRIYSNDVHSGYVRLIREKDNSEILLTELCRLKQGDEIHGPAVKTDVKRLALTTNYSLGDANTDRVQYEQLNVAYFDEVCAIHSPYWPTEATEWITRRRSHSFPSRSLIKQVVSYGCDFVRISHNKLNDYDWRFSFSHAELTIIKNWMTSHSIVYSILRVLNKRIANSKLCSYYFKTLMFWASEEQPIQFWSYDLLPECVCELLIAMMKWVKSGSCVNYFIPGNNMLDHLIYTDLSHEIDALWKTLQSRQLILDITCLCQGRALGAASTIRSIELPTWIQRAFVIYQRVENHYDNYTRLFSTHLAWDLRKALSVELCDVYRGLCFQQESVKCSNMLDRYTNFLKSESHLLLAANLCESLARIVIDNRSREFTETLIGNFLSYNTDESYAASTDNFAFKTESRLISDRQNLQNDDYEPKCLLYTRSMVNRKNMMHVVNCPSKKIEEGRKVNIVLCRKEKLERRTLTKVGFFKEWPGRSPTVNFSWFIAKAYLANLYYTSKLDFNLAIKTCNDVIRVYKQSGMNLEFAERTFPVILSTQWSNIYDRNIQELLGFYSLCSYVGLSEPVSRLVYLGVCPVQFALYLKARAGKYHTSDQWTVREDAYSDLIQDISDYNKHCDECRCDTHVNNGAAILSLALSTHNKKAMTKNIAVFYVIRKLLSKIKT